MVRRAFVTGVLSIVGTIGVGAQAAPPTEATAPGIRRWLDVEQVQMSARFRWIESTLGAIGSSSLQWQPQVRARVLLDREAKYSLHVGAFSGSSFISGWNNTGVGLGDFSGSFNVKQLFVSARPGRRLDIQAGSLYLLRGENTEITSYDNDAFIEGERVSWQPRTGAVTRVAFTTGYIGDMAEPSAFDRLHRMDDWNYGQALVAWRMGERLSASADYTYEDGRDILREGITVRLPDSMKLLTSIKLDAYERVAPDHHVGFDAAVEMRPASPLAVTVGVESVDHAYGPLNADRYLVGTHVYSLATYAISSELSAGWFLEEAIGRHHRPVSNEHRVELFMVLNPTGTLKRMKVF